MARACEAIDVARLTVYRWRDADPEFARDWAHAKEVGLDALEDEGTRRAFEGYDKPIVHQGVVTATMKEYSDTLLIFLLKGGKPEKYRERQQVDHSGGVSLQVVTGVPQPGEDLA